MYSKNYTATYLIFLKIVPYIYLPNYPAGRKTTAVDLNEYIVSIVLKCRENLRIIHSFPSLRKPQHLNSESTRQSHFTHYDL